MNSEIQYPEKLYTFEYKHLLLTLSKDNPTPNAILHFNVTPYLCQKIRDETLKKTLRELDEEERSFFEKIKSLIETKIDSDELYLLYRGTDKTKYPDIKRDLDIESVSDFFYNYLHGLEKGGYSFTHEKLNTMQDISNNLFDEIFEKIKSSLNTYSHDDFFKKYFKEENSEKFIANLNELTDEQKIRLKDYYFAYLHTVGTKDSGKAISYFVSTTKNISIGIDFFTKHEINKEHQVLTYYLLLRPYLGLAIDSHTDISLEELEINEEDFPRYTALRIHEEEVSIKGGLFPNHILGVRCYIRENEVFLVNPYLFMERSIEKMLIEGIPVNQREVRNQSSRNELDIIYKYKNEVFE